MARPSRASTAVEEAWRIFVNSMSDLFHSGVSDEFVQRGVDTMNRADWHIYQILTKRPQRMARMAPTLKWGKHIWAGVSS